MKKIKIKLIDFLNVLDDNSINQLLEFLAYDIFEAEKESKKYRIRLILDNLGLKVIDIDDLIELMALCLDVYKYDLFLEKLKDFLEND